MKFFTIFSTAAVTTILFRGATSLSPPTQLEFITCLYLECLDDLMEDYYLAPPIPAELQNDFEFSLAKLRRARRKMNDFGNVVVSVDRVKQGIKFLERVAVGASQVGNDQVYDLAFTLADDASTCLTELVTEYNTSGHGLIDDDGLVLEKSDKAEAAHMAGHFKQSARFSLQAIRIIANEYGSKEMPLCPVWY